MTEFSSAVFQTTSAKPGSAAPTGGSSPIARNSLSSVSSSRYRVHLGSTTGSSVSPASSEPSSSPPKTRSTLQNVSAQTAASLLARMQKNSTNSRMLPVATGLESQSGAATATTAAEVTSNLKAAKLPHKLRQHVSRLRSQFTLVGSPSLSSPLGSRGGGGTASFDHRASTSGGSLSLSSPTSYQAIVTTTSPVAPPPSEPKYSSQSQKMQTLQAQLSSLKMQTKNMRQTSVPSCKRGKELNVLGVEPSLDSPTNVDNPVQFFDLLRPLQNSLSCGSLASEWTSKDEHEDDESAAHPFDSLQQQQTISLSECDRSHMLRICCSLDNLLLSIGNQVQQEKSDEAIARGAARELLELFQFATKQVVTASVALEYSSSCQDGNDNNSNMMSGGDTTNKELQYMQKLIVEIAERTGNLDHFVRTTFLREIDELQAQLARSEQEISDLKRTNVQLQTEMNDLRDFHSQNNLSVLGYAGSSCNSSTAGGGEAQRQSCDDNSDRRISRLFPVPEMPHHHGEHTSESDELQQLRVQRDEFAKLLEMAKQEIRLCHRERDVQNRKIAEISSATFKDQELLALRNQLQSEKRRVKNLEIENVALRENEIDQVMKIHSLMLNGMNSSSNNSNPIQNQPEGGPQSVYGLRQSATRGDGTATMQTSNARSEGNSRGSVSASTVSSVSQSPLLNAAAGTNEGTLPSTNEAQLGNFITRQTTGIADTPPTYPKRWENSTVHITENESLVSDARWFYQVIGLVNESVPEKKQEAAQEIEISSADLRQFLSSLLANDKQLAVAQVQSKVRRQGSVPTISPKLSSEAIDPQKDSKGRGALRKQQPANAGDGVLAEDLQDMIAMCSQLIWVFYQSFLMAEEARKLIPTAYDTASSSTPAQDISLATIVLHFFLERTPAHDGDALLGAARFIKCLQCVKNVSANARFFCEFLDGTRSRDELSFFLWVLQAIEETKVGISYETPAATLASSEASPTTSPHICVLKATFLVRIIYRLFHISAAKRPSSAPTRTGTAATSEKLSGVTVSTRSVSTSSPLKKDMSSPSPRSSPRKKRKSRSSDVEVLQQTTNSTQASVAILADKQTETMSTLDRAVECFRDAVAQNSGAPLTLEMFNALLMRFATTPTPEELQTRLGPFFHPSGDEKKLPMNIFLALIQEMFANQLEWRKKLMRNLFISLSRQQEVEELARQQKLREHAETVATSSKSKRTNQVKKPLDTSSANASPKKKRKKKKSHRNLHDSSMSKYLTGLSRTLLCQFLLHAGIVADVLHVDVDQLFIDILKMSRRSARDIHFDEIYDALARMKWLGNRDLQVDPTTAVFSQQWQTTENDVRTKMVMRLQDVWSVQSRLSLALCENDPNVFVRRRAKKLADEISHSLATSSLEATPSNHHLWRLLQSIRNFLAFAWRLASKRTGEFQTDKTKALVGQTNQQTVGAPAVSQWFLTEFYFVNHAIEVVVADFAGYQQTPQSLLCPVASQEQAFEAQSMETKDDGMAQIDLRCFWDTRRIPLRDVLQEYRQRAPSPRETRSMNEDGVLVRELEPILKRFCYYLAHLFAMGTSAAFNCEGLTLFSWLKLARDFRRVDRQLPDSKVARDLFFQVYNNAQTATSNGTVGHTHEVWITKPQFTELLVRFALAKARACFEKKLKLLPASMKSSTAATLDRPAQVVADFCCRVVVPTSIRPRERMQEVDFVGKLSCPLVSRALLEHRAFLRVVFFYYAKQDESDESPECGDGPLAQAGAFALLVPQLGKTKRNSMNFGEFRVFLEAFELLDSGDNRDSKARAETRRVSLEIAQLVFRCVMALENEDTTQMEFEEFSAAVAALAVFIDPSPFRLWHVKIDAFVAALDRVARRKHLRFE